MVLDAISYAAPTCPASTQTDVDLSSVENAFDRNITSCYTITNPDDLSIELVWRFLFHGVRGWIKFRVILLGSQSCSDINTTWFVVNEMRANSTECQATENAAGQMRDCEIVCNCLWMDCKYVHFRAQMPSWMDRSLALCYFEYLSAVEVPHFIVWVFTLIFSNRRRGNEYKLLYRG